MSSSVNACGSRSEFRYEMIDGELDGLVATQVVYTLLKSVHCVLVFLS